MPKDVCKNGHDANWYETQDGQYRYCRSCKNDRYDKGASELSYKQRVYQQHLRMEVLLAYGGECACCREWRYEFLTIDHINNDGAEHRRKIGTDRYHWLYPWLKNQGYPEGFQVLCINCNCSKQWRGYCPHKEEQIIAS